MLIADLIYYANEIIAEISFLTTNKTEQIIFVLSIYFYAVSYFCAVNNYWYYNKHYYKEKLYSQSVKFNY